MINRMKIECFRTLLTSSILARGYGAKEGEKGCLQVYFRGRFRALRRAENRGV